MIYTCMIKYEDFEKAGRKYTEYEFDRLKNAGFDLSIRGKKDIQKSKLNKGVFYQQVRRERG